MQPAAANQQPAIPAYSAPAADSSHSRWDGSENPVVPEELAPAAIPAAGASSDLFFESDIGFGFSVPST